MAQSNDAERRPNTIILRHPPGQTPPDAEQPVAPPDAPPVAPPVASPVAPPLDDHAGSTTAWGVPSTPVHPEDSATPDDAGYLASVDTPTPVDPTAAVVPNLTPQPKKTPWWIHILRAPTWPALALLLIYAAYPQPFSPPDVDTHVTPACWAALGIATLGALTTRLWRNPACLLLFAFWGAYVYTLPISTSWTDIYPDATAETHLMQRGFILAALALFAFAPGKPRIAGWWVAVLVLLMPLGYYEVLTTNHFRPADAPWEGPPRSPMGLFFNPNFYAGMVLTGCFAAIVALMLLPRRPLAWTLRLLIVAAVPLLWFTYSRASVAALLLGCVVAWLAHLVIRGRLTHPRRWRLRTTLTVVTLVVAVVGGGVASTTVPVLRDNNPVIQILDPSTATRSSDNARLAWTLAGLDYLREKPLTGIGAGAFERTYAPRAAEFGHTTVNMHNALVQLLCQYGFMLGALWIPMLLFFPLQVLRVWWRRRRLPPDAHVWACAQLLFLAAFLLLSQLVGKALIVMPWWLLIGTCCAISHHLSEYLWAARRERKLARRAAREAAKQAAREAAKAQVS